MLCKYNTSKKGIIILLEADLLGALWYDLWPLSSLWTRVSPCKLGTQTLSRMNVSFRLCTLLGIFSDLPLRLWYFCSDCRVITVVACGGGHSFLQLSTFVGVLPRVSSHDSSRTRRTPGCLEWRCGKCLRTARSLGLDLMVARLV